MIVNFIVCCWDLLFRRQPKYFFTRGELLKWEAYSASRWGNLLARGILFSNAVCPTRHAETAASASGPSAGSAAGAPPPGPTPVHPIPRVPHGGRGSGAPPRKPSARGGQSGGRRHPPAAPVGGPRSRPAGRSTAGGGWRRPGRVAAAPGRCVGPQPPCETLISHPHFAVSLGFFSFVWRSFFF